MMVKAIFFRAAMYTFLLSVVVAVAHNEPSKSNALAGEYVLIVEGYDWGPAASRVVLSLDVTATEAMAGDYTVAVVRVMPNTPKSHPNRHRASER